MALTAGCQAFPAEQAVVKEPHPLEPLLRTAETLRSAYQEAIDNDAPAVKTLEMLHANHSAHVETLTRIVGVPEAKPVEVEGDLAASAVETLTGVEDAAATEAAELYTTAAREFTVLIGEIAACRSCHVTVLGEL